MKFIHLILLVLLLALSGCHAVTVFQESVAKSWDSTKDFIDPPPDIDTEKYQFENPNQEKLATLFTPVDGPLTSLARYVEDQDTLPGVEWLDLLRARFPWIDHVFVTNEDGVVMFMQPAMPVNSLDSPLIFKGEWSGIRSLALVDYAEFGAKLYMVRPYYRDIQVQGLIGVGFDPRSLLALCPEPSELIVIQPGGGVWSRGADVDKDAVLAVPWDAILADNVQGQVKVGAKYYTWLVRYIGNQPYIYATESIDPKAGNSWWFF